MRTTILFTILTFTSFAQTTNSIYQTSKKINCFGTVLKTIKDSLYIVINDSCTTPIFDTLFNGVYVFVRTPSNAIDRIVSFKHKQFHGQQIEYYKGGQILMQGQNKNFKRSGKWTEYYETGEPLCISYYKNGKIKTRKCFDKNGKQIGDIHNCAYWLD